jgi:hypothetical protein
MARQARFGPAFPKITATDCDAVRPAVAATAMARQACLAERWQKDKLGRKMGFPLFSHLRRNGYGGQACPNIFLPVIHFLILPS